MNPDDTYTLCDCRDGDPEAPLCKWCLDERDGDRQYHDDVDEGRVTRCVKT